MDKGHVLNRSNLTVFWTVDLSQPLEVKEYRDLLKLEKKMVWVKQIMLLIAIAMFSACTTHKADFSALEMKKGSTFEVAVVEVEGTLPYSKAVVSEANDIEKKTVALQKIQIDKICDVLSSEYGLQIDKNINKKVRNAPITKHILDIIPENLAEPAYGLHNPYFGNRDYVECGWHLKESSEKDYCINNRDVGNYISIIYGFSLTKGAPWEQKNTIYYQIQVKSDGAVLVEHSGNMAVIDLGLSYNPLNIENNLEGIKLTWDDLLRYADQVDEALSRDIAKTKGETIK